MMKVLGIIGSERKDGNTAYLVQETLKTLKSKEIATETIFLGDYNISGCNGCENCKDTYRCVIHDDMQKIYPLILNSDAIVLGSPTYFYNITSLTKAFLERFYCFQVFAEDDRSVWSSVNEALGGKYALVIAICEQDDEKDMGFTPEAMSLPLAGLGYRVLDTVKILKLYKKEDILRNKEAVEKVRIAGEKLGKTLQLRKDIERNIRIHLDIKNS